MWIKVASYPHVLSIFKQLGCTPHQKGKTNHLHIYYLFTILINSTIEFYLMFSFI